MYDDVRDTERKTCIGLDVHEKTIYATFLDDRGNKVRELEFRTRAEDLLKFVETLPDSSKVGLEASTAGKSVLKFLRTKQLDVSMAPSRRLRAITECDVKTDKRASEDIARLLYMGFFPTCYVPPPHIERIRQLVRNRMNLGQKATMVKNQIHALVVKNLYQSEMEKYSSWFGKEALRTLVKLPFNDEDRMVLKSLLEQMKLLIDQEEQFEKELARIGEFSEVASDVKLLMTIPGIDFYTALAIIGEIGDVKRFPTKRHLYSDAGVVPKAANSGEHVSKHQKVKHGNTVLKYFLCCAVQSMVRYSKETSLKRFYNKKKEQIGPQKAKVAAARKLSGIIWRILTDRKPYEEENEYLTKNKLQRMRSMAEPSPVTPKDDDLLDLANDIGSNASILENLTKEDPE